MDGALAGRGHDGNADAAAAFPATDAMITNLPGVALTILVADCAPVVLYDPVRRAAGVAHSGRVGHRQGRDPPDDQGDDGDVRLGPGRPADRDRPGDRRRELRDRRGGGGGGNGRVRRRGDATADPDPARARHVRPGGRDPPPARRGRRPGENVHDLAIDTRTGTADFFSDRAARPCGRFAADSLPAATRAHGQTWMSYADRSVGRSAQRTGGDTVTPGLRELFLFGAGVVAGLVGTAGGITSLVSYPALLLAGVAPLQANIANLVALVACWPGSAVTSQPELRGRGPWLLRWGSSPPSAARRARCCCSTRPPGVFGRVVPFLVAAGSLALLFQPWLAARPAGRTAAAGAALLPAAWPCPSTTDISARDQACCCSPCCC